MTPDRISFIIPGNPVPKGRPRISVRDGKAFARTPAKTVIFENLVKHEAALAMDGQAPYEGPVDLKINVCLPHSTSWPAWKRDGVFSGEILQTSRPDLDNYIKAILDGLNGVVFKDDAQVVNIGASKFFAVTPRIYVQAEFLGNAPSVVKTKAAFEDWSEAA